MTARGRRCVIFKGQISRPPPAFPQTSLADLSYACLVSTSRPWRNEKEEARRRSLPTQAQSIAKREDHNGALTQRHPFITRSRRPPRPPPPPPASPPRPPRSHRVRAFTRLARRAPAVGAGGSTHSGRANASHGPGPSPPTRLPPFQRAGERARPRTVSFWCVQRFFGGRRRREAGPPRAAAPPPYRVPGWRARPWSRIRKTSVGQADGSAARRGARPTISRCRRREVCGVCGK